MNNKVDENSYIYEVAEYLAGKRGMDDWSRGIKDKDRILELQAAIETAEAKAAANILRDFEKKYPDLNIEQKKAHDKEVKAFADFVNISLSPKTRIMDLGEGDLYSDGDRKKKK